MVDAKYTLSRLLFNVTLSKNPCKIKKLKALHICEIEFHSIHGCVLCIRINAGKRLKMRVITLSNIDIVNNIFLLSTSIINDRSNVSTDIPCDPRRPLKGV